MKILITGGLGFIGSNFVHYMLSKYNDVQLINVDNLSIGSNPANLRYINASRRYKFIKGDITDKKLMNKLVTNMDRIVNFAAETHVDRSIAEPWPFLHSNTIGAVTLFEVASKHKKRLLQVSTDEVYGDILNGSFEEDDLLKPSSPYSASKAAADLFAKAYHRTYKLDVVIVRCTNNYGSYQYPEKLIPKTILRAFLGLPIPIYGKGLNVRDWIFVQDFCRAIDLILKRGKDGEIYNVSSDNELRNIDVVHTILEIMGKSENLMTFVEDRPGHDIRYSLDSSKIRSELGWSPVHDFEENLEQTVNWYLNGEWWWKPLVSKRTLHPTPWKLEW